MDEHICALSVRFALKRFLRRRPCLYMDMSEWRQECVQIAWCAVLEYALVCPVACSSVFADCMTCSMEESSLRGLWDSLSDLEREWVRQAANEAGKALERFWHSEHVHQKHNIAFAACVRTGDIETELDEFLVEDTAAAEALQSVLTRIDEEQILTSLQQQLSSSDWTIVARLLSGQSQKEIAQILGVTPSAVCQRLRTIARKCAQIREQMGLNP